MFNQYGYNPQLTANRIDNQIAQLQQMKEQLPQAIQPPTNLTQNFQLAPTQGGMKYVNSMEDVNKEVVYSDTPFFSNDLSVLWVKNAKGNIKAYELKEIVQKDEKDLIIESLQMQLNEMSKQIKELKEYEQPTYANDDEPIEDEKPSNVSKSRTNKTK